MTWCLIRIGLQVFIGGILLVSALGKALDVPGFVGVLDTYRVLPAAGLFPVAVTVMVFEAAVGAWVISGRRLAESACVAGVMNLGYALWMTISLARGLHLDNCGCFGVFFPQPLRWYSPLEDLVLVGASVVLWRLARDDRSTATDPENRK